VLYFLAILISEVTSKVDNFKKVTRSVTLNQIVNREGINFALRTREIISTSVKIRKQYFQKKRQLVSK
jgi:hypothetical protein